MGAGRDADAIREFTAAIPVLIAATQETAADETSLVAARSDELQLIVEGYIGLMAKMQTRLAETAIESFHLADSIRSQSVQQALSASSARVVAKDPALAELIRKEQDLAKQINAQLGVLNNALALPSSERDEAGVRAINATIEKARSERAKARAEIARRFPSYADLIDPKSPSVEHMRDALRPGEAFLSFYFGHEKSFVWAVPKQGAVAFAPIDATAGEIESKVRKLREALEPRTIRTVYDIPPFDLALAYELYRLLLEPVEAGWKQANSLIVVTNGALGLLPLSLLPTAPTSVTERRDPWFALYRTVPWLGRTHAVSMVPSAAALRALRQLPPGSAKREPLVGFGDPFFSAEQAAEAERQQPRGPLIEVASLPDQEVALRHRAVVETRQIDSADLARLPRLPDTADELKSIALSLHVDPSKALHLGKDANERVVKGTDLSRFRIVAFATHGLMPGDLTGLTQPALALSAPTVADVDGDGLLTMGRGVGSQARCRLGCAICVQHCYRRGGRCRSGLRAWASLLLRRHPRAAGDQLGRDVGRGDRAYYRHLPEAAADPKLARAEALRQAMLGLIDGPGYVYAGNTVYSYAYSRCSGHRTRLSEMVGHDRVSHHKLTVWPWLD